jgi:hypothetical protein
MAKIRYNKEKTGRTPSRSGPRDIQIRQRVMKEDALRRSIADDPKPVMKNSKKKSQPKDKELDLSQYLPLDEVRKKIEEAIKFTEDQEKEKYESSLKNLNSQLNESKIKIRNLTKELEAKERIYLKLESKLDKVFERISNGSIGNLVGKKRPELEDKIFIDPLVKNDEPELDSHINVNESSGNDMTGDLAKLRNLLKRGG